MSVINRVLQDLDRQAGPPPSLPPGIRSVPETPASRGLLRLGLGLLALGVLALAVSAWWLWPFARKATPVPSPATQQAALIPRQDRAGDPVQNPVHAPLPSPPTIPPLRLSRELSPPAPHPPGPPAPRRASAPAPAEAQAPVPPPLTPSPRLDTQLSLPAPGPQPRVVKELKPLTPAQEAEALWLQGAALVEKGRSSEAQALLEQCLQRHPAHLKARQTLVMLALEAGRRAEAENLLRQGISLHPGMVWFPRSLAQLYLQQGDYAQAASVLKDGLGRQAEAEDWALYASTLAKLNQPEDTATAYREALRRDPSQGAWWIGLGVALEQGGHAAEARAAYQRALQSRLGPELRDFAAAKLKE